MPRGISTSLLGRSSPCHSRNLTPLGPHNISRLIGFKRNSSTHKNSLGKLPLLKASLPFPWIISLSIAPSANQLPPLFRSSNQFQRNTLTRHQTPGNRTLISSFYRNPCCMSSTRPVQNYRHTSSTRIPLKRSQAIS